jgi:hypothetical protein
MLFGLRSYLIFNPNLSPSLFIIPAARRILDLEIIAGIAVVVNSPIQLSAYNQNYTVNPLALLITLPNRLNIEPESFW